MKRSLCLLCLTLTLVGVSHASNSTEKVMESFEEGIPAYVSAKGGKLSLDPLRFKHGNQALKWDWVGNDSLIFNTPIGYHQQRDISTIEPVGRDQYIVGNLPNGRVGLLERPRGFFMWVYNEKATTQHLTFQFGRDDKVDCEFDYRLNFKGWRTVWIIYDRGDMRGTPHPDMNRMTIQAPNIGPGTFYIDAVGLSLPMNPRNNAPNMQLPFIDPHPRLVTQYAQRLLEHHSYKPSFPLEPLTEEMSTELSHMNTKVDEFILPSYDREKASTKGIDDIRKDFAKYEIKRIEGNIYGRPLVNSNIYNEFFVEMGLGKGILDGIITWRHDYGKTLFTIAARYRSIEDEKQKAALEGMFVDLFDYGLDQGFAVGEGLGWLHHYSYVIRQHAPALYLMRDVLEKHDRLEQAIDVLKWYTAFGQVYREDIVYGVEGRKSADADDTQGLLKPRLYSALMMKNSPEKVRDLKHYSSFFSNVTTAYANGLDEIFKPDGTCFHHAGHSMGYGGRGINGATSVLYLLSDSPFSASKDAWRRMRKIVQTFVQLLFTEELKTPRTFPSIRFQNFQYPDLHFYFPALIALSSDVFDVEMAGLYQQLIDTKTATNTQDDYWLKKLEERGKIGHYTYPKTNILPYSRVSVHRDNNNWMASVRGHSKYVYPYESWEAIRFAYPTFISFGYLEVSYPNDLDSTQPSYYVEKTKEANTWQPGYDWHRWPGTTSVHVPYDQIMTTPGEVEDEGGEYPFSDQAFVGGVASEDGNSIYVFPFKGHDKFGLQSFTGKKSYFFFDDLVVCLGSQIKSEIADHAVETTLLQNQIVSGNNKLRTSRGTIEDIPYKESLKKAAPFWIIDPRNTGYYIPKIPKNTTFEILRAKQTNPDFKGKSPSSGEFSTVLFNHGVAPDAAAYQYAVVVDANEQKMDRFLADMKGEQKPYEVIQQNKKAHIVRSPQHGATSYAVFDESAKLKGGIIKSVNRPATFVVTGSGEGIKLAVSDPDLNIYDGQDDLLPDGSRCELAVYMREWYFWPSRSTTVQLTLKGAWKIEKQVREMETAEHKRARIISVNSAETLIEFECRDGLSAEVGLKKVDDAR